MFTKKNYLLFIILLILSLGAWAYTVPYQKWQAEKKINDSGNFLSDVNMDLVDKIEVSRGDLDKNFIKKNNGVWLYGESALPTEKIIMDSMEEKLRNIATSEFVKVSINPDKKTNFGINQLSLQVKMYQGDVEMADFFIGNLTGDYQSTYISRNNDDNTYSVADTLVQSFDYASWPDKTITDSAIEGVDVINLNYPNYVISLTNKPAATGEIYWRSEKPYALRLNKEKVEEFLNKALKLEATSMPPQAGDDYGLENPVLVVEISGADVNEKLIFGGQNKNNEYYIKQEKTGHVYLVTKENKEAIFKQIKDFQ